MNPIFTSGCKRTALVALLTLVIPLFTSGATNPLDAKTGEEIQTVRERYEAAGAKQVNIPLAAPEVDSKPNQTGPVRKYHYVAYEYNRKIFVIYYLDGKVTSVVEQD